MRVSINPGTEPIEDTTEEHAITNILHFCVDSRLEDKGIECIRLPSDDHGGRYAFLLWKDTRCHHVLMPGIPLDRVRYMGEESQNIWHFPRLYVDGGSWVWSFALLSEDDFKLPDIDD